MASHYLPERVFHEKKFEKTQPLEKNMFTIMTRLSGAI